MKINAEQFNAITAKLDWLQSALTYGSANAKKEIEDARRVRDESLASGSEWCKRIEEQQSCLIAAQDKIWQSHAVVAKQLEDMKTEFDGDLAKLYDGHGLCLKKLGELFDAFNLLLATPVPRKSVRRRKKS